MCYDAKYHLIYEEVMEVCGRIEEYMVWKLILGKYNIIGQII